MANIRTKSIKTNQRENTSSIFVALKEIKSDIIVKNIR